MSTGDSVLYTLHTHGPDQEILNNGLVDNAFGQKVLMVG